jgi:DNA-binding MarR family transcriptional regulator
MTTAPISPRVLQFVAEKIDTVAELETLLIMSDDEHRQWSDQEVAARLYTTPAAATRVLDSLVRRELITADGKPARFRFNPARSEDRKLFAEVAEAYRRNLVAITTFIHSKASASVQDFARAFDLKKDQ